MSDDINGVTITVKAGTGFDAPWLVVRGTTAAAALDHLQAFEATGGGSIVGRVAEHFRATALLGDRLGATPVTAPAASEANYYVPQPSPQEPRTGSYGSTPAPQVPPGQQGPPPGVVAPVCQHGTKRYIVGKYGPFWGCPAPMQEPTKCKVQKIY